MENTTILEKCAVFLNKSKEFLIDYIKKNNIKSLVIGISGGIDSTVVAAIAQLACNECKIPLIGRSLPCSTNKEDEVSAARLVGESFCDDFKEVVLEDIYGSLQYFLEHEEGQMSALQMGNVKARLRMIYLYNLASINGGVVLDTDNLTEHLLGFWTLKGDEGDVNIGLNSLWKTQVYYLAESIARFWEVSLEVVEKNCSECLDETTEYLFRSCLNKIMKCVRAIHASVALTPTDGNGVSKSDCDQFGLKNYEEVDDVIKTVRSKDYDTTKYDELVEKYGKDGVDKVINLIEKTEHKRTPRPISPSFDVFDNLK